jgi:hypothetical protein
MTVIRLDAATLAKFQGLEGRVLLADESGNPVLYLELPPGRGPDPEPKLTAAEWQSILDSPVKYTTEQVLERLRRSGGG